MPASTQTPRKCFSYPIALDDGFVYTLRFHASTREEADRKINELLTGSSFQHWLDKMLPVEESEIGSMH